MEKLGQIIRELQRRLVWQVLTIYLVGAFASFRVSQAIAERRDLPAGFTAFFIVLLVIGLAVVLTTTFVQEGFPGASNRGGETDPEGKADRAESEAGLAQRVFTWRNAILGGVAAFTLWAIVAVGWLVLAEQLVHQIRNQTPVESPQKPPR